MTAVELASEQLQEQQLDRPEYAATAPKLIDAIKARITVAPVFVPEEADSDTAGIPSEAGKLVPVACYQGPAVNYRREEWCLPSSAHPEPRELRIEEEVRGDMQGVVRRARDVAVAESMQEWWGKQKGLEARTQAAIEGVRATTAFTRLMLAQASLTMNEHAREWTNRVPRHTAESFRSDLEDLVCERESRGQPVTDEDIERLLEKHRREGLRHLFGEVDLSQDSDDRISAQTSTSTHGSIFFAPPVFTEVPAYVQDIQMPRLARTAVRLGQITMLLTPAVVACQATRTPIALTPIPRGATDVPVQTVLPENPPAETSVPPVATATEWAAGGPEGSYEATLATLLTGRQVEGGGYRIPSGLMQRYDNVSDIIKNPKNYPELIDAGGNSIAGAVNQAIGAYSAIDASVYAANLWSGEGYVIELRNAQGKLVWAIDTDGVRQYRPDIAVGVKETERFDPVPDAPILGEYRYMVTGGNGILGVFQEDVLKATFNPQLWEWQEFLPPETATPEVMTVDDIVEMLHGMTNDQLRNETEVTIATKDGKTISLKYESLMSKNGPFSKYIMPENVKENMMLHLLGRLSLWRFKEGNTSEYPEFSDVAGDRLSDGYTVNNIARDRIADGRPYTTDIIGRTRTDVFNYDSRNDFLDSDLPVYGIATSYVSKDEFYTIENKMKLIPYLRVNRIPNAQYPNIRSDDEELIVCVDSRNVLVVIYHNEISDGSPISGWWNAQDWLNNPAFSRDAVARGFAYQMFRPLEGFTDLNAHNWGELKDFFLGATIEVK